MPFSEPSPSPRTPFSPAPLRSAPPHAPGHHLSVAHQREERAEARDGAEGGNVGMHVLVLGLGVERVLTLDPAAFHILVPALGVVSAHQGRLTLA